MGKFSAKSIGNSLRKAREDKQFPSSAVAESIGKDPSHVSRLENGFVKDPRLSTLWALADTLDISLDKLVGRRVKE